MIKAERGSVRVSGRGFFAANVVFRTHGQTSQGSGGPVRVLGSARRGGGPAGSFVMSGLELRFLGDLTVVRDGEPLALPPSKKTRALLAYLALSQRPFRREHLCELLWEIPDDPRGSLRWSLSKLRRLVDDDGQPRIVADRSHVRFDATDVAIDVAALHALVGDNLAARPIAELEDAAGRYRGNLLEGLELANFHDFHAWFVAERELAGRAQSRLLATLVQRLAETPQRALEHARALVAINPYDEAARATLIRLLVTLGHTDEAAQQYQLATRMLEELGAPASRALYEAWRGPPGGVVASTVGTPPQPVAAPPVAGDLVGRESQMKWLAELFSEVTARRQARFALVRGEPGIGKSRLLQATAALAREAGALLLEASAFESEAIRPFALWIDAVNRRETDTGSAIFAPEQNDSRDRLFARLSDLVARETTNRPVVLLFDDLQWCDESSAAALHYVARMNRQRPLLGVLAARDDAIAANTALQQLLRGLRHDDLLQELKLGPLGEDAVRRLIAQRAPGADGERLSRECGGNPLLAIELARAESAGDSAGSLDELVRERLSRLDTDAADVLRWAAVLAPRIDLPSLARVADLDTGRIGEALEAAERQAMLLPADSGFRFTHNLIARSVYQDISPARRQAMHRRVAELLEREAAVDPARATDLAHHAAHSGDAALAARAMVSAGRLCLRFFANDDALALARRGIEWAEQLPAAERTCLILELRDIMLAAAPVDDWKTAAAEFVALAEQALDHGALAHARLGYQMASYLRWVHGQWTSARDESLQAERVTRSADEREHIVGMAEAAKCLAMLERDLTRADAMLMEAQALAVRRRLSHHAIPAALGMLRFHENRLEEASELFEEARTLCKSVGDRVNEFQANEYLVMIDFERGRFDAALERCSALVDIGDRLREGSEAPFARALEGLCRYALTDETGALDAALEDLRIADAKHRLAYTLTRAALIDIERDRPADAAARATEALGYAELLGRATETTLAHVAIAQACRATGDAAGFERHTAAIDDFADAPVACWARARAAKMTAASGPEA